MAPSGRKISHPDGLVLWRRRRPRSYPTRWYAGPMGFLRVNYARLALNFRPGTSGSRLNDQVIAGADERRFIVRSSPRSLPGMLAARVSNAALQRRRALL